MPQYVSLAQQGFFQPYELLGDSLRHYQDRKIQQGQFNKTLSLETAKQQDLNKQRGVENTLAQQSFQLTKPLKMTEADQAQLALNQAKLAQQQQLGLTNFNIHNMGAGANVPEMIRRPGASVDINSPFEGQSPTVQQSVLDYAHKNNISPTTAIGAFRQQQAAETNRPFLPQLPGQPTQWEYNPEKGYTVKGFSGAGAGTAGQAAPPGHQWVQNPQTGEMTLQKLTNMDGGEAQRIQSLDTLKMQMDLMKENMNQLPHGSWVPGYGWAARHLPTWAGGNPHVAAFEANRAALGPDIYRGIMNQQGIMRDEARKEVNELIPQASDTPAVRKIKMDMLDRQLKESKQAALGTLGMAGRDVRGFDNFTVQPPQGGSPQLPQFKTEAEARAAGLHAPAPGQPAAMVYDPAAGRFRPWAP